jgi:hypothetical protein
MIRVFVRNRLNYGQLENNSNWSALTEDVSGLLQSQLGEWRTSLTDTDIRNSAVSRSIAGVVRTVYEAEAESNGKKRVFIKENQGAMLVPFYLSFFEGCKMIHLVRDPRDMALSWKRSGNHPGGIMRAAEIWQAEQKHALMVQGCLQDSNRFMTVRYEDILSAPQETMRLVCAFLELDFEEQMLNFHANTHTVRNAKRIQDWSNLAKPIIENNYNKYMENLSESEIRWVEHVCSHEMKYFGYSHSLLQEAKIDSVEQDVLKIENEYVAKCHIVPDDEAEIRERRLAVINRIINRNL